MVIPIESPNIGSDEAISHEKSHGIEGREALRVVFFGGSITDGYGATDKDRDSWRALVTQWLEERWPTKQIFAFNAGVGGTGSDLGAFRCQRDVLVHQPDLVFIEFCVNDSETAPLRTRRALEGIVRQIRRHNPQTAIVLLSTVARSHLEFYERGELPPSVAEHEAIARHYELPFVHGGRALWQAVTSGTPWDELMLDDAHPCDDGYRIYAASVQAFLETALADPQFLAPRPLPPPLEDASFENARLVDAWEIEAPGWTRENESLAGHFPHRIAATAPFTQLEFEFEGRAVGIYWLIARDSGQIEFTLDGGAPQKLSSWDKFALYFERAHYALLADDLAPQEHTLTLHISPEKDVQSEGTAIRIGAFLVDSPAHSDVCTNRSLP